MSVLLFVALAVAGTPDAQATPVAKEKKVCRSDVPTGSMMAKRTCHTRAEWEQIDAANQDGVEQARNRTMSQGNVRN